MARPPARTVDRSSCACKPANRPYIQDWGPCWSADAGSGITLLIAVAHEACAKLIDEESFVGVYPAVQALSPRLLLRSVGPVPVLTLGRTWLGPCGRTLVHSARLLIDWLASGLVGCFSSVRRAYIVRTCFIRSYSVQGVFKRHSIILGADDVAGPRAARLRIFRHWVVFKRHSVNADETAGRRAVQLNIVREIDLVRTVLLGTALIPNTHNGRSECSKQHDGNKELLAARSTAPSGPAMLCGHVSLKRLRPTRFTRRRQLCAPAPSRCTAQKLELDRMRRKYLLRCAIVDNCQTTCASAPTQRCRSIYIASPLRL